MRASHFAQMRTEPRPTGRILNLPALGFLVVFAVAAYGGANIVAFERLPGWVRSAAGQPVDSLLGPILTWKNTTGVATRARTLVRDIVLARTPGDTAAIENALDEVVKASPSVGCRMAGARRAISELAALRWNVCFRVPHVGSDGIP